MSITLNESTQFLDNSIKNAQIIQTRIVIFSAIRK
jgi:hypothetical protein